MAAGPGIGRREREILTAIVETYISSGEPVGSRTLSRLSRENLSAASVRNVMADLAEAGYLDQPHTSAGRIPTPKAYRFYVNQLTGEARLSPSDENLIQGELHGLHDVQEFMERTSHVLSLISHGVGITVTRNPAMRNALEHVYFQRLGDKKVLAVVVTRNGLVHDRLLRMETDLSIADLEAAANYINLNFRGWEMEALRSEVLRRAQQERSEYDRLMRSVEQLSAQGALETDVAQSIYVEGASNLVITEQDKERLRQLLATLEEKQRMVDLLSAYLDARQEAVRVVVGLEEAVPHLNNFVLIGAPARVGDEVRGSLAVIGPTRMDYEHTITAVSYIARLFDQLWNEST